MSFSRLSQSRAITVVKIGGKLTAFSVLSMKKRQKHRFKKKWKSDVEKRPKFHSDLPTRQYPKN